MVGSTSSQRPSPPATPATLRSVAERRSVRLESGPGKGPPGPGGGPGGPSGGPARAVARRVVGAGPRGWGRRSGVGHDSEPGRPERVGTSGKTLVLAVATRSRLRVTRRASRGSRGPVLCDDEADMTEASAGAVTSAQTSAQTSAHPSTHPRAQTAVADPVRRAVRLPQQGYLGGVASGLADHLRVPVLWVRVAFVVTAVTGFGVLFYAGLWLALPLASARAASAPGLDAATRQGKRSARVAGGPRDAGVLVAGAAVALGVAGLVGFVVGRPAVVWPAALAVLGVAVLWRQADEAQRERWSDVTGRADVRRVFLGPGSATAAYARVATGIGLLAVALLLFAARSGQWGVARDVLLAASLGVMGLALTLGPWLLRLARDLSDERAERVRSQERADVAAHLHDSVLQTLALIQRSAADPGTVTRLARAQERDLREWMFGGGDGPATAAPASLAAALRAVAAEVEGAHGTPVEVVTVGDTETWTGAEPDEGDTDLQALVAAVRESVTNAARHSGADRVDVYAEVVPGSSGWESVEVFVRDRGRGFDPAAVPADRHGVRRSIVDRVQRHGGTAAVRSAPGEGTEVRLSVQRRGSETRRQGRSA